MEIVTGMYTEKSDNERSWPVAYVNDQ